MENNMRKMRAVNQLHRKKLKELGYYDIVLFPHTRWFKDVFGLWDGVCKKAIAGSKSFFNLYWLQLKTGYASQKEKKALKEFCINSNQKGLLLEYTPVKKRYRNKKGYYVKGRKIIVTRF